MVGDLRDGRPPGADWPRPRLARRLRPRRLLARWIDFSRASSAARSAVPAPHCGREEAGHPIDHHHAAIGAAAGAARRRARCADAALSAAAEEWEKITGARLAAIASAHDVAGETWLRSTSMPRRFISPTTASAERREAVILRLVGARCRPIRWSGCGSASCSARRGGRIGAARPAMPPIWRPPSIPISEAISARPCGCGPCRRRSTRSSRSRG